MEIERVKKATINDLVLIIDDIKNIRFEEKLSYKFNTKDLQNDQFVETLVYPGIYVLRMSVDKEFSTELELQSGVIYTMFFLFEAMAMFVVENDQCLNPV